ncbi:hypothetical protein FLK61_23710 [Paenalkalicoccus suaedae]|uniref:Uncharacterized protein n=1 Tax=Paenalkalicoccus suaedae TaxID=2592382 RepID=A0A859FA84_9BACI|nr:hypothetical protein [Paenalkalicoccus suaedae]QKS69800.1 hypothetical protein FLK61_23710 [Paenalkalicoccus suaedae]
MINIVSLIVYILLLLPIVLLFILLFRIKTFLENQVTQTDEVIHHLRQLREELDDKKKRDVRH